MTLLHLESGATRTPDSPPTANEFLILKNESIDDLQTARQAWFQHFPPQTPLLLRLLLLLISADFFYRRAHQRLQHAEFELALTGSEIHEWHPHLLATYNARKRDLTQAQQAFHKAQRELQSAHDRHTTPNKSKDKPAEPEPPPAPKDIPPPRQHRQFIHLSQDENGNLLSRPDPPAAWFLQHRDTIHAEVWRDLVFKDSLVPAYYQPLFTINGETFEPCDYIETLYDRDEFLALCELEVATQAPHPLDRGKRLRLKRFSLKDDPKKS